MLASVARLLKEQSSSRHSETTRAWCPFGAQLASRPATQNDGSEVSPTAGSLPPAAEMGDERATKFI